MYLLKNVQKDVQEVIKKKKKTKPLIYYYHSNLLCARRYCGFFIHFGNN